MTAYPTEPSDGFLLGNRIIVERFHIRQESDKVLGVLAIDRYAVFRKGCDFTRRREDLLIRDDRSPFKTLPVRKPQFLGVVVNVDDTLDGHDRMVADLDDFAAAVLKANIVDAGVFSACQLQRLTAKLREICEHTLDRRVILCHVVFPALRKRLDAHLGSADCDKLTHLPEPELVFVIQINKIIRVGRFQKIIPCKFLNTVKVSDDFRFFFIQMFSPPRVLI